MSTDPITRLAEAIEALDYIEQAESDAELIAALQRGIEAGDFIVFDPADLALFEERA